jgi:hypothetical protein
MTGTDPELGHDHFLLNYSPSSIYNHLFFFVSFIASVADIALPNIVRISEIKRVSWNGIGNIIWYG